jgi:hypothetical protein
VPLIPRLIEDHWPVWPYNIRFLDTPFWHLTNAVFRWADKYHKNVVSIPIDRATADIIDPDAWSWVDDD